MPQGICRMGRRLKCLPKCLCVCAQLSGPLRSPAAPPQAACFSRSCSRYRALGFEDIDDGKYFLRTEALCILSFLYAEAQ